MNRIIQSPRASEAGRHKEPWWIGFEEARGGSSYWNDWSQPADQWSYQMGYDTGVRTPYTPFTGCAGAEQFDPRRVHRIHRRKQRQF